MQTLGNIDALFRVATLAETRAPEQQHDRGDLGNVHHFEVPMPMDGSVYRMRMIGQAGLSRFIDLGKGTRLYLIEALNIEGAGVTGGDPEVSGRFQRDSDAASLPPPGATQRFAHM